MSQHNNKQHAGFTLIEVAVALAILAVVTVTAMKASALYIKAYERHQTRVLAQFVANNARHQWRLNPSQPIASSVSYANITWQITSQRVSAGELMQQHLPAALLNSVNIESQTQAGMRIQVGRDGQVLAEVLAIPLQEPTS
ncbi:MAG: type II secretion system minor pseudopilin GspI [Moraxella sp.]|nr:type II secretion system minor pseudopilin GspI [Moraxella sp.]